MHAFEFFPITAFTIVTYGAVGIFVLVSKLTSLPFKKRKSTPQASSHSLTVIVPAYNEAEGLARTLDSLLNQTQKADRIIVVNDRSRDATLTIAASYARRGVEVFTPRQNLGSKAKAQNYALPAISTDLVMPIDGDTILDPDYIEKLAAVFADPKVSVAAGCVLTQRQKSLWEKARQLEYLLGFHFYRSIQQSANSITVCSGCCTVFRCKFLDTGFPVTTLTEDIFYTWSQHIAGRKAVYVHDAVARAAEPVNLKYLNMQLKRWKCGWFHGFRLQFWQLLRHKPMVAIWAMLQFLETLLAPVIIALPILALIVWHTPFKYVLMWWLLGDLITFWPAVLFGCWKRKISVWRVISWYPTWYILKVVNFRWDVQMFTRELVLVPLGRKEPFTIYERGKA